MYGWRSGTRPKVSLSQADQVLTRLDMLWWDVWNETTVRTPIIRVLLYSQRTKRHPNGHTNRVIERGLRDYGDRGPDLHTLNTIRNIWEGDAEEALAA